MTTHKLCNLEVGTTFYIAQLGGKYGIVIDRLIRTRYVRVTVQWSTGEVDIIVDSDLWVDIIPQSNFVRAESTTKL